MTGNDGQEHADARLPQPNVAYVSFSAEINVNTAESLIATMANLAGQHVDEVVLLISSPGGSVMNGMNLYNVLVGMPFKLITHNVGNVDSIANAIFLAGEVRYASPHSTFMFHGVATDVSKANALDEKTLRERTHSLVADQKRIAAVIQERTNLEANVVEGFFREGQTKDTAFAIGAGIIHEIKDVQIPARTPIVSLVFQR